MLVRRALRLVARGEGALLMVAGLGKCLAPCTFLLALMELGMPKGAAEVAAVALVCVEVGVGHRLLARLSRASSGCAIVLLVAYTGVLGIAEIAGRRPTCHCLGPVLTTDGWSAIIRNVALAALLGADHWVNLRVAK